jgi:cell division protein FtsB
LDLQVRQEEDLSRRLKASIDAIHHDPATVERLAREQLYYAKTNEVIIRFESQPTNAPTFR